MGLTCALGLIACPKDASPPSGSSSGSSGSSGSTGARTSTTSSTTSSDSTGEPAGPRVCKRACELPAKCCPADQDGCPSMEYPGNWGCFNDVCVLPQCQTDSECEAVAAGTTCEPVGGLTLCVTLCQDDTDCEGNRICGPTTDRNERYCLLSCVNAAVFCPPGQICDEASGQCLCERDDQCPAGFLCRP